MAAGDCQNVRIFLRNASQQFRAAQKAFSRPPRAFEAGGMTIHRFRINNDVFPYFLLSDRNGNTALTQPPCKLVFARIAAAHTDAAIFEQERKRAHAHAADPDKIAALFRKKGIGKHTAFYAGKRKFVTYFFENLRNLQKNFRKKYCIIPKNMII